MSPVTTHGRSLLTHMCRQPGDRTGLAELPVTTMTESWCFLARVEVAAPEQTDAFAIELFR